MFYVFVHWKLEKNPTLIYLTGFVKLSPEEILLFLGTNSQIATMYDWQFPEPFLLGSKIVEVKNGG